MLLQAARGRGHLGRIGFVGRQDEAGLLGVAIPREGDIEIPAFTWCKGGEPDVENGLVDLQPSREGRGQGEVADVKGGGVAIAQDERVGPDPVFDALDAVVEDGEARAVRGYGVSRAFVDQFIRTVLAIGTGPFPADDVLAGIVKTEDDGVLDDAVRGASRVFQMGEIGIEGGDDEVGGRRDGCRFSMRVHEQLVDHAVAVVVKGQRDAAVFQRGQDPLDVARAVDDRQIQGVGQAGAADCIGHEDLVRSRGRGLITRLVRACDGAHPDEPLIGGIPFRGAQGVGTAVLIASRGDCAQVGGGQDLEGGRVGAALRMDASGGVDSGIVDRDGRSRVPGAPAVVHSGLDRADVELNGVPRARRNVRGGDGELHGRHPLHGEHLGKVLALTLVEEGDRDIHHISGGTGQGESRTGELVGIVDEPLQVRVGSGQGQGGAARAADQSCSCDRR